MAIKFASSPTRSKSQRFCSNKHCLLYHLRSDKSRTLRPISYRRDTILLEQGQPVLGVYSICHGWVKVARRTVRGKIAGVDLRGPGELIGARELLADEPHFDIYAQTIDDVQTIWLDRAYLLDLMSRFPEIALAASRRVAQINGAVQRRLSHALHAGLEEKIAYLLSCLHKKQTFAQFSKGGQACERLCNNLSIRLRNDGCNALALSNDDLAGLVGSTPEAASKALCELVRRGFISRDRCQIEVLDAQSLTERAELTHELVPSRV